jgi:NAD(P)-dependent dehydrogenase (short-subunit alcohol dehydrogenase family)
MWNRQNLRQARPHQIRMDLQLEGKRALITGSTAGIGFSIAEALAKEGAAVIVNGRTKQRVDEAVNRLKQGNRRGKVEGLAADLAKAEGAREAIGRYPEVEILVNNLGSGVRLSRHYLPRMKQRNCGRIVFISSESALQIPAEMIHYGMTKTAQLAISRGLAETTMGTNVTVNCVLPGPTASEGVDTFLSQMAAERKTGRSTLEREFFRSVRPTSLLQRFETTEEIASVVAFVCSPRSSAINGAALRAEGGLVRAIA